MKMYKGSQRNFISELKGKTKDALYKMIQRREDAIEDARDDSKDISKEKRKACSKVIIISKKRPREDHKELHEEEKNAKKYKSDLQKEISLIEREISSRKDSSLIFSPRQVATPYGGSGYSSKVTYIKDRDERGGASAVRSHFEGWSKRGGRSRTSPYIMD